MSSLPSGPSPDNRTHVFLPVLAIAVLFLVLLARALAA